MTCRPAPPAGALTAGKKISHFTKVTSSRFRLFLAVDPIRVMAGWWLWTGNVIQLIVRYLKRRPFIALLIPPLVQCDGHCLSSTSPKARECLAIPVGLAFTKLQKDLERYVPELLKEFG